MKRPLFAIALLLSASAASADIRRVWAVNDGEKVERDARGPPAARAQLRVGRHASCASSARATRSSRSRSSSKRTAAASRALSLRLPSLVSPADRITYQPPRADPTDYVGRPIQIFGVNYMHVDDAVARVVGVQTRLAGGARRIRPGGSRCSSCRRTRAPDAAACRSRSRPNQNQAIWIEVYVDRARTPGRYRGTIEIRADGGAPDAPDRARGLRLHAARREQHARDAVLLERSAGAVSRPQPRCRLSTASPTVTASSWSTPTTSRRSRRVGPLLGDGLHARPRVRGPGRRRRQRPRAAHLLRSRAGSSTSAPAPGRAATRG